MLILCWELVDRHDSIALIGFLLIASIPDLNGTPQANDNEQDSPYGLSPWRSSVVDGLFIPPAGRAP